MPSVLVTGAGRGIGLAITTRMSNAGWDVYAGARSAEDLQSLSAMDRVHAVPLDITDAQSIADLGAVLPTTLDGLVNNAGIVVQGPVETMALADIARQLDVNVTAQIAVTQAILPLLRPVRGRTVFISSLSGRIATPGTGAYCASKFALEGFADALRIELRRWKMPVILVEPSATRTDIWTGILDDFDSMVEATPPAGRELYAHQFARTRKALPYMQKTAVPPEAVAIRVEHALVSKRPKRRYLCDNASRVQAGLTAITPAAILDRVLAGVMT